MNITSKGRYALQVMLDLACHTEDGYVSLKTIADRQGISIKYLEAIVGSLKRAKLLDSTRGKEGGYKLIKPAGDYSVGEILRCMEGSLAPVSCIKDGHVDCDKAACCLTAPMWMELDELTNRYLDGVNLAELLSGERFKNIIVQ